MRKETIAAWALPSLLLVVSANVSAADPVASEVRLTPFVLGQAQSKAAKVSVPLNEREAIAEREVLPSGIVVMELPADRMVDLVRVVRADGTAEILHGDSSSAQKQEVK